MLGPLLYKHDDLVMLDAHFHDYENSMNEVIVCSRYFDRFQIQGVASVIYSDAKIIGFPCDNERTRDSPKYIIRDE